MSSEVGVMKKAIKQPSAAPATVRDREKRCIVEYIVVNIICLFVFLAFGYIALMSYFQTSLIDPDNYVSEKILYQRDMILFNIALTVLFLVAYFIFFFAIYGVAFGAMMSEMPDVFGMLLR